MVLKKRIPLAYALLPLLFLILALFINIFYVFGDDGISGSNQIILMVAGLIAGGLGLRYGSSWQNVFDGIASAIQETSKAILILLAIGALAGGWLVSGVIPAFIYYGVQILNPSYFLPATIVISAVISLATGSSWNTTATIGLALMGIGAALGVPPAMTAGAVISGAYFGDKMSPLSDTTNLAAAVAGTDLFTHIRYMMITTVPSITITLIAFTIMGFYLDTEIALGSTGDLASALNDNFNITPWLFLVPIITIGLIIMKIDAVIAILIGALSGGIFAVIFQPHLLMEVAGATQLDLKTAYIGIMKSMYEGASLNGGSEQLSDLLSSDGMQGMLDTIWLIVAAMVFGGAMQAVGFLQRISSAIVSIAHSVSGLIGATVGTGLLMNVAAPDQYLAIVVPGKMYREIYRERGLAPENLSRSLEDSGTVTSVLIPYNTCGAYQSGVLMVPTGEYFIYAIFNWLSPIMSILVARLGFRIKMLDEPKTSSSVESTES